MFGFSTSSIEKFLAGGKRTKDWYKYLFEVVKAKYLGGNPRQAYRKYELYCELMHEELFPYGRLMEMYDTVMGIYKEIRDF